VVTPSAGSVILVPFPFSDLSNSKLRPAAVLADAAKGDWVLCQITSKPYSDPQAIELDGSSFQQGSLHLVSYARPGKLFTAHQSLMVRQVAVLKDDALKQIVDAVVTLLRRGLKP
jgi:mRNA interferase MazF